MGREPSITYEQVAAAADSLKATGSKPTNRAIRDCLGKIGSMGTINKLLQTWKSSQERQITNALALPVALQQAILDFMDQELACARATLEAELVEHQQEAADLANENERQAASIEEINETVTMLQTGTMALETEIVDLKFNLATANDCAGREREAAEGIRTELAMALVRLEAMPRLEADLAALQIERDNACQGRVSAEQRAAVLVAKMEAATDRITNAETTAAEITTHMHKCGEAMSLETAKAEMAQNTIANLAGKLDAMQSQVQQQASELNTARQDARVAIEKAAELRGKYSSHADLMPIMNNDVQPPNVKQL